MKKLLLWISTLCLTSCSLVQFQPIETLNEVQPKQGYRLQQAIERSGQDQTLVIMMFSGGGTRAAGLGYGVLAHLHKHPVRLNDKRTTLVQAADLVYGVSGGSVLAAYYALHGADTIPQFEHRFLKQDFQRMVAKQSLSLANAPRLASPQFGRGDLLQEELENTLFGKATFGDLQKTNRPFAVISATDMSLGNRIDFIKESFDVLCLNLSKMPISRAVAASSAVPSAYLSGLDKYADATMLRKMILNMPSAVLLKFSKGQQSHSAMAFSMDENGQVQDFYVDESGKFSRVTGVNETENRLYFQHVGHNSLLPYVEK